MNAHFYLQSERDPIYSEFNTISSDEEETFSDGVSRISSESTENMMDVKAQLLAMNIDNQLSTAVAVRGKQMTLGCHDDLITTSTPLCCGGPYSG